MSEVKLILGDCLSVMAGMPDASVDAICTDPPAGIAFMGKEFDDPSKYQSGKRRTRDRFLDFLTPRLAECLRLARPGARMLCWAIPRTSHWTGTAIEDAGWIIEDRIAHIHGQGFPKGRGKLKPAIEDWWMARKPSKGVPDLNIDACRVEGAWSNGPNRKAPDITGGNWGGGNGKGRTERLLEQHPAGRYPANLVLSHHPDCRRVGTKRVKGSGKDGPEYGKKRKFGACYAQDEYTREKMVRSGVSHVAPDGTETVDAWECVDECPIRLLDEQSGERPSRYRANPTVCAARTNQVAKGDEKVRYRGARGHDDSGSASRFFLNISPDPTDSYPFIYCPKASPADRGPGNNHPTVKSTKLCEWLTKLITPNDGIVLDPFMGSGSIGLAAARLGFGYIGIESDPEYYAIAERRFAAHRDNLPLFAEFVS